MLTVVRPILLPFTGAFILPPFVRVIANNNPLIVIVRRLSFPPMSRTTFPKVSKRELSKVPNSSIQKVRQTYFPSVPKSSIFIPYQNQSKRKPVHLLSH